MNPSSLGSGPISHGIIHSIPQNTPSSTSLSFTHILNTFATGQTKPILTPLSPRDVVSSLDEGKYKLTLTKNSSSGQIYVQLHKHEEEASASHRSLPTIFAIPSENAHRISSSPFFGALINQIEDISAPIINITKDEEHLNTHDSHPLALLLHYADPEHYTFELKPSKLSFYQELFDSTGCYSFISPSFLEEILLYGSKSPETKNECLKLLLSILEVNPKDRKYHTIFSNFCRDYISHNGIKAATTFFSFPERAALCHNVSQLNFSHLRFYSEHAFEFLKLFPNLTTLNVSRTGIASLPNTLTKLTRLDISGIRGFNANSLRPCIALKKLLASCTGITSLPDTLTELTTLNISYNSEFDAASLRPLRNLTVLLASNTDITSLPDTLTELTQLDIGDNSEFDAASLRPLRNLTVLLASNTGITFLPDTLTELARLDIYGNIGFDAASLSPLRNLTVLLAPRTGITSFPDTLTALIDQSLDSTRDIPGLVRSRILQASNLGRADVVEFYLQRYAIDRALQSSAISRASGPHRERIQALLRGARIEALIDVIDTERLGQHLPDGTVFCTFDHVKANPLHYFERILEHGFPTYVRLIDNPHAIDHSGVTKQFITTLVAALVTKRAFPIGDTNLPQVLSEPDKRKLADLGKFYSLLHARNEENARSYEPRDPRSQPLVIGALFDHKFFEMLLATRESHDTDTKEKAIASLLASVDSTFNPLKDIILDPSEEHQSAYAAIAMCKNDEALAAAKEDLIPHTAATEAFLEGMSLELKELFITKGPEEFAETLQGSPVSKEALLASICPEGIVTAEELTWVLEKIASSDKEWRVIFVKGITGNNMLSPGLKIKIRLSNRYGFEIHTCFSSIDMPIGTMSKEAFLRDLDKVTSAEDYTTA
ncbi:MAG: hypothetical protein K9M07_06980 [Simkaniaceae bacterium]|nr:hypothetical protein [Simkaniaceae bacterium]